MADPTLSDGGDARTVAFERRRHDPLKVLPYEVSSAAIRNRALHLRYRTAVLNSRTHEEAPVSLRAWIVQRTRWMKGWMQTFVVHNRHPIETLGDMGWRAFIAFEIYVASMILSAMLHTFYLVGFIISLCWLGLTFPASGWGFANAALFVVGYSGAFAIVVAGLARIGEAKLLPAQAFLPFYWILHTIAAARAAYELFMRPDYWAKTAHGRTKMMRSPGGARRRRAGLTQPAESVQSPAPGE